MFAAGHRKIYKTDLETMDVHFRRLLRSGAGPPSQTNWLNPWHEILHDWNARVAKYVQEASVLMWSQRSAGLPDSRWVSRTLAWRPRNVRKRGAPLRMWHSAAETFCRWKGIANWKTTAKIGTNIRLIFVLSFSRVEAGYVRFRLCKCLCLKWATQGQCATGLQVSPLILFAKNAFDAAWM